MNDKKICFIYCVNDRTLFEESKKYVQSLEVPAGFEVEILDVEQAPSMTAGYNLAMKTSDAKYKVYLHQDVFIINKQFIAQVVDLFSKSPEVGVLGIVGAKTLPANAIWWDSTELYGKVYDSHKGKMDLLAFQEIKGEYQVVEAVDGLLIATQYDLPWREDLFDGWHYYDVSQGMEFVNKGYKVVIPNQENPWVLHDCGVPGVKNYFYYKSLFIHHYDLKAADNRKLPLVSILIPTYNRPHLFELALRSALEQTYPNIEVIICDDSTNDETEKVIQKYLQKFNNLIYVRNEKNLGQFQNDLKLFELANGEYVNYLMDDDLFHPEKIEKMMRYYLSDDKNEIKLVTSHRLVIDDYGNFYPEIGIAKRLFEEDTVIEGIQFGDFVLGINANFIGEPTTPLFRKADLKVPFGTYFGREYGCNVDMATWLNLMSEGKIVYISETLSFFRYHSGQQQQSLKMEILGAADYAHELLHAPIKGFFMDNDKYAAALKYCINRNIELMSKPGAEELGRGLIELRELNSQVQEQLEGIKKITKNTHNNKPLVSVLIPAYNRPYLLELAIQSVLAQSYPNIEIIICDDSTNDEVERMIKPYLVKNSNIFYYKNEKNLHADNPRRCLSLAKGEYVNFLMDDDLFHPEKIELMMEYFLKRTDLSLVTSTRQPIDINGNFLNASGAYAKLFKETTILTGIQLGNLVLKSCMNIIGEPTTVLFKKSMLGDEEFGYFNNRDYGCINDVATWITLLKNGNAVFISEALSYFRIHPGQNQRKADILKHALLDWFALIVDARQRGFLTTTIDYKVALKNCLKQNVSIIETALSNDMKEILNSNEVLATTEECVGMLLQHEDPHYCPMCNHTFRAFNPWPDQYDFTEYSFEMYNKYTFTCPVCFGMDRERFFRVFLEREKGIKNRSGNLLHIAPEQNLRSWLSQIPNLEYKCADLFPQDPLTEKMDITKIQYPNETFDIVLCSHVLEHIPNDIDAISELYRVMKRGGWGILQVPIATNINLTYEDFSITDPEQRRKVFGQEDHVRIYARDYIDRLKIVGFKVEVFNFVQRYGMEEAIKIGLSNTDNIYVVYKD